MGKENEVSSIELIQARALAQKVIEYLKTRGVDLPTGANVWDVFAEHLRKLAPEPQERLEADNLINEIRVYLTRHTGINSTILRGFTAISICSLMRDVHSTLKSRISE